MGLKRMEIGGMRIVINQCLVGRNVIEEWKKV